MSCWAFGKNRSWPPTWAWHKPIPFSSPTPMFNCLFWLVSCFLYNFIILKCQLYHSIQNRPIILALFLSWVVRFDMTWEYILFDPKSSITFLRVEVAILSKRLKLIPLRFVHHFRKDETLFLKRGSGNLIRKKSILLRLCTILKKMKNWFLKRWSGNLLGKWKSILLRFVYHLQKD